MDPVGLNRKVEELWDKVYAVSPRLMSDWIECFSDSYRDGKRKSMLEIKKSLSEKEYQTDPRKNFIWRLTSSEHGYRSRDGKVRERRVELAAQFLRVMTENTDWQEFFAATWSLVPVAGTAGPAAAAAAAAHSGSCGSKDRAARDLHEAARLEDVDRVAELIATAEPGEVARRNEHGYTALHAAAKAVRPNAKIARLLVDAVQEGPGGGGSRDRRWLNATTDGEWGENSALHIAAANDNVTQEFVHELRTADSRQRNAMKAP